MNGVEIAKSMKDRSYCPYSNFRVGACIEFKNGEFIGGNNVENSSYGLTICAERVAVFNAITQGKDLKDAVCIYISTDSKTLTPPCGACLQVLSEFWEDIKIVLCNNSETKEFTLTQLLPNKFGKDNMD